MTCDWPPYLQEGEELLWQGRPDQRFFIITAQDAWAVVFLSFVYWLMLPVALSSWFERGDWRPALVLAISLPTVLFIRLVLERSVRLRARYAITNKRGLSAVIHTPSKIQQFHLRPNHHFWRSGWRYPVIGFSRKKPGLLAKLEPILRLDRPPGSPLGAGIRAADLTFRVPDNPDRIVAIARDSMQSRDP